MESNTYAPRPVRYLFVEFVPGAVASVTAWGASYDLVLNQSAGGVYQFRVPDSVTDSDYLNFASIIASSPAVKFVSDAAVGEWGWGNGIEDETITLPPFNVTASPIATGAGFTIGAILALVVLGVIFSR